MTTLKTDRQYTDLLDAQSKWPNQYVMSTTQATSRQGVPIDGRAQVHVGGSQIDTFNRLLPEFTTVRHRRSENKPQTELFGTAPYVAQGRGHLQNVDASNAAWFGAEVTHMNDPRRQNLAEARIDRFDFLDVRPSAADLRLGQITRAAPKYLRPGMTR
jgi:hypothetical protein